MKDAGRFTHGHAGEMEGDDLGRGGLRAIVGGAGGERVDERSEGLELHDKRGGALQLRV